MKIFISWALLVAAQAAPPPTTLEAALKAVPADVRQKLEGDLSAAKEKHKAAEYWVLGNAVGEAIKSVPRRHWLPVFLTAMRKADAKTSAALFHTINTQFGGLYFSEEEIEKDRMLDAVLARETLAMAGNSDKLVRLGAVKAIKGLVEGGVRTDSKDHQKVEYVDKALREKMRTALETAAKDADRDVREVADAALRELKKEVSPAEAAKLAAKTIDQWLGEIAPAIRNDLGAKIDKALAGEKSGMELGQDVYGAIIDATLEDWAPLLLTRLKNTQGKKAAALLFAIWRKSKTISMEAEQMRNPASLRPLDGLTVMEAAPKLNDADLDVRKEAHRALDHLLSRTYVFGSTDPKLVGLDSSAIAALLKAYEAASKDSDPELRKAATQRAAKLRGR